jgi:hypothetical protein
MTSTLQKIAASFFIPYIHLENTNNTGDFFAQKRRTFLKTSHGQQVSDLKNHNDDFLYFSHK